MPENSFKYLEHLWRGAPEPRKKIYRNIFNVLLYFVAAVAGVGIDEVTRARCFMIIFWLFCVAVFIVIIIYDYEKQKDERTFVFLRPWFLLIVFCVLAMGKHYSDTVTFQSTLSNEDGSIIEFSNKLNSASNTITLYRSFDTRSDDLALWGIQAWEKKDWPLSKQLFELSFQAENENNFEEASYSVLLADDNLMLTNSADSHRQFRQDLTDIINKISDQSHSLKRYSFWNNTYCLGYETHYLNKMIQDKDFPKDLKPDVKSANTNITDFINEHGGNHL